MACQHILKVLQTEAGGHQLTVPSDLMWPSAVLCTQSKTVEQSLPRLLRDTSHNTISFDHSLKTFFLSEY